MKILNYSFLLVILIITSTCNQKETQVSSKINFNNNWSFQVLEGSKKDSLFFKYIKENSNWQSVQLPHTPKIEPKIVNNQWQGISVYKTRLFILRAST